jgi:hypothetical protein
MRKYTACQRVIPRSNRSHISFYVERLLERESDADALRSELTMLARYTYCWEPLDQLQAVDWTAPWEDILAGYPCGILDDPEDRVTYPPMPLPILIESN